ncbi:MAG: SRPBCC domain-containing protein [Polyangiaceae bacterium]
MKTIRLFQALPSRSSRIFRALTDPQDLSAWHADVVKGRVEAGRTLELSWPRLGASLELSVERVVPGRRVVLTSALGNLEMSVENGGVELCHSAPFDDDTKEGMESSWKVTLSILQNYLGRHVDRSRRVHWAMARVQASPELCHAYFTDPHLLRTWFGEAEAEVGPTESRVNLTLGPELRVRGPVLSHSPGRDVALRWQDADDSVLVFRTLPVGDGTRCALLGWSRWSEPPNAAAITQALDRAAQRLENKLEKRARA